MVDRNTSQDETATNSNEDPAPTVASNTDAMPNGIEDSKNTVNSNSLSSKNAKPFSPSSNGNTRKKLFE